LRDFRIRSQEFRSQESGGRRKKKEERRKKKEERRIFSLTTDNCTGEAFGELFLAMIDNLSSKCFAPTDN
jgi:hypothetical protein